jgi:predicted permease
LWQQKFSSDPSIVGRSIALEGVSRQVVGVMPADFQFPSPKIQFWIPLHLDPNDVGIYWSEFMPVFGRLRPGATLDQARAEASMFIPRIRTMFPWKMPANLWPVITAASLQESVVGDARTKLLLLLGAIGLVLLIACANVANLLLARAATRQKEIAVRAALGASRGRIFRQLLTESVLLAVCGGALGLAVAVKGLSLLEKILPADTPRLETIAINWHVLVFTAAIAILTGIVFGLAPALHSSKLDLTDSLKGRRGTIAAGSHRLRRSFAVSEIALAFVLVIAAGLMIKSLWQLAHVDPGFRAESIATARITPSESFCLDFTRCTSFYSTLLEHVKALPGVTGAALVNVVPLDGREADVPVKVENYVIPPGGANPMLWENISTTDYLRLMGIPLFEGRSFTAADGGANAQPVVLVSQATARRLWPGQDPIGKHLKPAWLREWHTVVGLVGDVHEDQLTNRLPDYMTGEIYFPFGPGANLQPKHPPVQMTLLVRTSNSELDLAGILRPLISDLSQEIPVTEIHPLSAIVADSVSAPRSIMSLFAAFAVLALLLGGIGIYGVVSYSTAQRTSEIGLRMALGAQPKDVLRMVLRGGARLALTGVALGLLASLALTRLLTGLLYGVSATDPLVFGGVSVLLALVALAACYLPARRATTVDPLMALREE